VKPVALVADAIRDCSRRKEIILDPFLGSGTTVLAAQKTGRIAYGMELDPRYVDVVLRRWITSGGAMPRNAETGQTFEEVAAERLGTETPNQDTPTPINSSAEASRG
jgi:DNA modification methylase